MDSTVIAHLFSVVGRVCCYYTLILIIPCLIIIHQGMKRYNFVRNLSWIPGPRGIPVLGNTLSLTGGQVEFFKLLLDYSKKYGPIFKLWVGTRPFVFISSAEFAQPILNSKMHIDKSSDYKFLNPWLGTGLLTSSGSKWQERRKFLTPAFHYSMLEEFIQPIKEQSHILVKRLSEKVNQTAFNFTTYAKLCTLDIICVTAMGKCINAQLSEDNSYVKAVDGMNGILQRRFITPWLKPDFFFNRSRLGKKQEEYVKTIRDFVEKVIIEKRNSLKSNDLNNQQNKRKIRAFLELLLTSADNGAVLTDEEIRDEVNTFMFAGHDTTSVAIGWCLFVLGKRPDIQEDEKAINNFLEVRILEEYNDKIGNEIPNYKDLQKLEYLDSVIKEVMRLYPVVPLIARDIKCDVNINNNDVILPGTTVLIFSPALHRDPKYFDSPNDFIPERFMNKDNNLENPFAYIPFSAGPRNCIGSKFASIELKIVLHAILEKFIVTSVESEEDLNLYSEIVLLNKNGIQIKLQERTPVE